jgi:hypothetical protein
MAKKGKPKANNENTVPAAGNDAGETTEAPKGKKQKKTYN